MKKRILFVCLGNICRSPAAEAVMNKKLEQRGIHQNFECDSAGTGGYHIGERADARMRSSAEKRRIDITSRARQFQSVDFEKFDFILTMDDQNQNDILAKDHHEEYTKKIMKITDFSSDSSVNSVPDPYYGGQNGFEKVLDILDDCCENFLENELLKEKD